MESNVMMLNENSGRATVMSKSGYRPTPKSGYGGNVMSILFSLFMIFGGLSGRFVLRGTGSSKALVVAGIAFLVWDIVGVVRKKSLLEKAERESSDRYSKLSREEKAVKSDERVLPANVNVRIVYDKSLAALDMGPRLNGRTMTQNSKNREYTGDTKRVKNIISFMNLDLSAVFEIVPASGEIVVELFRDKNGIGIRMPDGTTLLPLPEV